MPGVLPFVGHGDDIEIVKVLPLMVVPARSGRGDLRLFRVAPQSLLHIVVKKLLGPDHARQCLTLNLPLIEADIGALDGRIKGLGLGHTLINKSFKVVKGSSQGSCR